MQKVVIDYNKKSMWRIFEKEFLNNGWSIEKIAKELNLHKGTIKRWVAKEEVPPQYFNDFNRLLKYKYKLNVTKKEEFKIMDQFFTPEAVAKKLIDETISFIEKNYEKIDDYTFIEPSAGDGSFANGIPSKYKKVILDIDPKNENIIKADWLKYTPNSKRNIVIGNPPFGLRGQLALKFINHAAEFADFIAFILPPLFNSNGKGSPRLRVNAELSLVKETEVENIEFRYPSGEVVYVNSIFQIWTKKISEKIKPIAPPEKVSEWIRVFALSNGDLPSSKRNVKMIDKCDFYLPSTTFKDINICKSFNELPHNRGYGIVARKKEYKEKVKEIALAINWGSVSFKSTNGANNLRTQLIIDAIEKQINIFKRVL